MTDGNMTTSMHDIQAIVRQIVERFTPQKVVLFGSHAYGELSTNADVDLLVIKDTEETPPRFAAKIAAAIDHPFPIDIVVWRPAEFAASLARKGNFATQVALHGLTLYETGNR